MARSNKPIIWSLFAAGGTFAAFVTPVMIVVTGLAVAFGLLPAEALAFERVLAVVQHPIGKGLLFLAVCYGLAALATLIAVFALFRV